MNVDKLKQNRDVVQEKLKSVNRFRKEINTAAINARKVHFDDKTGLIKEMLDDALVQRANILNDEVLSFKHVKQPYEVFVDNTHDYLELLKLSLRQILKTNYDLTDKDLNDDWYANQYKDWYRTNIEHHFNHELGEHFIGANENTTLKSYLGVSFYRQDNENKLKFYPLIDFDGQVRSDVFAEYVLKGSDEPSKYDKIIRDGL